MAFQALGDTCRPEEEGFPDGPWDPLTGQEVSVRTGRIQKGKYHAALYATFPAKRRDHRRSFRVAGGAGA